MFLMHTQNFVSTGRTQYSKILGNRKFGLFYINYLVKISVVNRQYKTKEII